MFAVHAGKLISTSCKDVRDFREESFQLSDAKFFASVSPKTEMQVQLILSMSAEKYSIVFQIHVE